MRKGNLIIISLLFVIMLLPAGADAGILSYDEDAAAGEYNYINKDGYISFPTAGITALKDISRFNGDGNLIIAIDPGHGMGHNYRDDKLADEGTMNYKVALALKNYLENNYENITIFMTRDDTATGSGPSLEDRGQIAADDGADLLISCHFNATSKHNSHGGEVFVSVLDEYKVNTLAENIVKNLTDLGIVNRGVKTRLSGKGIKWADNIRTGDYYGIIKHSATHEIPAIIIEHCFYDSSDYTDFADTDDKLNILGEADAKAIADTFKLDENIHNDELEDLRNNALTELENCYNSLNKEEFSSLFATRSEVLYENSRSRLEAATGRGKIDLTLNRAINTLKQYPEGNGTVFKDIKKADWFYDAVTFCYDNGYFCGVTDTTFEPYTNITRGMFVTVLGRMAEAENTVPADSGFKDVNPNKYYAPYVKWARDNNIVAGVGDNRFEPNTPITRQELARIFMGFCNYSGKTFESNGKSINDFPDADKVAGWARESMNWAVSSGIINGSDELLQPEYSASRAQVAQIIYNSNK